MINSSWVEPEKIIRSVRDDIEAAVEGVYPTRPYIACVFGVIANQISQNGGRNYVDVLTETLGRGRKPFLSLVPKKESAGGLCFLNFRCDPYKSGYLAVNAEGSFLPQTNIAVLPTSGGSFSNENLRALSDKVNQAMVVATRSLG